MTQVSNMDQVSNMAQADNKGQMSNMNQESNIASVRIHTSRCDVMHKNQVIITALFSSDPP